MKLMRKLITPVLIILIGISLLVVGTLYLTTWRPSGEISATTPKTTQGNFVVTRPGVLELNANKAYVTVEGKGELTVAIGHSTDISAWVAGLKHSEIVGMQSDTVLAVEEHDGQEIDKPVEPPAEGKENPDQPRGLDEKELAKALAPASADTWEVLETGTKKVTLEWPQKYGYWSLMAFTKEGTPKVTLMWKTPVSLAWVNWLFIAGTILIVLGLALAIWILLRSRKLQEDGSADSDSEQAIDSGADESSESKEESEEVVSEDDELVTASAISDDDKLEINYAPEEQSIGQSDGFSADLDAVSFEDAPAFTERTPIAQRDIDTTVAPSTQDYATGNIPSRRALREARLRGEATIQMGDKTFSTGLTPVIGGASAGASLSAGAEILSTDIDSEYPLSQQDLTDYSSQSQEPSVYSDTEQGLTDYSSSSYEESQYVDPSFAYDDSFNSYEPASFDTGTSYDFDPNSSTDSYVSSDQNLTFNTAFDTGVDYPSDDNYDVSSFDTGVSYNDYISSYAHADTGSGYTDTSYSDTSTASSFSTSDFGGGDSDSLELDASLFASTDVPAYPETQGYADAQFGVETYPYADPLNHAATQDYSAPHTDNYDETSVDADATSEDYYEVFNPAEDTAGVASSYFETAQDDVYSHNNSHASVHADTQPSVVTRDQEPFNSMFATGVDIENSDNTDQFTAGEFTSSTYDIPGQEDFTRDHDPYSYSADPAGTDYANELAPQLDEELFGQSVHTGYTQQIDEAPSGDDFTRSDLFDNKKQNTTKDEN